MGNKISSSIFKTLLIAASFLLFLGAIPFPTHTVRPSADPSPTEITAVTAGANFTCILLNGGVKCWGNNVSGQLGDGSQTDRSAPVDVPTLTSGVTALAAGSGHTCALLTTGAVKCWGNNNYGQVGNGTNNTPVTVPYEAIPSGASAISAGYYHTCAVVNGGVKCWGYNSAGQLGNGNTIALFSPTDVITLGSGSGVVAVANGAAHTCALVGSSVQCWGRGQEGQLGNAANAEQHSPVPVNTSLLTSVQEITAGANHTCARMNDRVLCWGHNSFGQLGDATNNNSNTPVYTIALEKATGVSGGALHTCAIADGGAQCWGNNQYGQLGTNDTGNRNQRTDVNSLDANSGVLLLASGGYHTCAVVNNGVQCWGSNEYGQLGNPNKGINVTRLVPGDVVVPITGQVTYHGSVISNITISASPSGTTVSSTDKGYTLLIPASSPAKTYTLTPSGSYTFTPVSREVPVGFNAVSGQNFSSLANVSISGRITRSDHTTGVMGVTVSDGEGHSALTDSSGNYTLQRLEMYPSSAVSLTAQLSPYTFDPAPLIFTLGSSSVTGKDFTATRPVNVRGDVVFADGTPAPGVTLQDSEGRTAVTNTDGSYTFQIPEKYPAGRINIYPQTVDYTYNPTFCSVNVGLSDVSAPEITAWRTIYLTGKVLRLDGSGTAGVVISDGQDSSAVTDSSGGFTFQRLEIAPPQSFTFTPAASGWTFTPASLAVQVGSSSLTLSSFTARRPVTVSGFILDGTGAGLEGISVSDGNGHAALTGAGGQYALSLPDSASPRAVTLTPRSDRYTFHPPTLQVSVGINDISGQNFTASPVVMLEVSGRIYNYSGQGLAGITVNDGLGNVATTDSLGDFGFEYRRGDSALQITLTPQSEDYIFEPVSRSVSLSNQDIPYQNFTSTFLVPVTGYLYDPGSQPVSGVEVAAQVNTSLYTATSDSTGQYILHLPAQSPALNLTIFPASTSRYQFKPTFRKVKLGSQPITVPAITATLASSGGEKETVVLNSPENAAVFKAKSAILLDWGDVDGATSYRVQYSSNSGARWKSKTVKQSQAVLKISGTQTVLWKVAAYKGKTALAASDTRLFSTLSIPGAPRLVTPKSKAKNISLTPTFTWEVSIQSRRSGVLLPSGN